MGRQHYTKEFKQDAVDYFENNDLSLREAANNLKISASTLGGWVNNSDKAGIVSHRGSGNHSSDEAKEIARLKKELKDKTEALEILKKAMGILNDTRK